MIKSWRDSAPPVVLPETVTLPLIGSTPLLALEQIIDWSPCARGVLEFTHSNGALYVTLNNQMVLCAGDAGFCATFFQSPDGNVCFFFQPKLKSLTTF